LKPIKKEKINRIKGHLNFITQKTKKTILTNAMTGAIRLRKGYR
jgi:hypothetical protein